MFAMSDDELLFDEVLNSGLQAELLQKVGVEAPLDALDPTEDPVRRLFRTADDMWSAYTTPPATVRH